MDTSSLTRRYRIFREEVSLHDMDLIRKKGGRVFNTSHGIFGTSAVDDLFEIFKKIGLDECRGFVDLGSGDGRIALLASLFTRSRGIEADSELHALALSLKKRMRAHIPEVAQCDLICGDYTQADLGDADTFFIYADHSIPERLERALLGREGVLFCYQNIFPPRMIKKGKTYWVNQTPIVSYPLR